LFGYDKQNKDKYRISRTGKAFVIVTDDTEQTGNNGEA
jgi:molybdopterin-guanine dinucleotide biosynthesis protein